MTTIEQDVAFAPRNYGLPEDEVEKRVNDALEMVNISHLRTHHSRRKSRRNPSKQGPS
ncbi:MAG: hypothetical protein K6G52_04860 [Treponemataceae bacterium]|nr:hypothetical protein [Treponemataceae bacterium]